MKTSWRRFWKTSWRSFEEVLKMSCQDVLKMSWKCLEEVCKTCWRRLGNTSWRRLEEVLKTPLRRMAKTKILVLIKTPWRRLEDVFWRRMTRANIFVLIKTSSEDDDERRLQHIFIKILIIFPLMHFIRIPLSLTIRHKIVTTLLQLRGQVH